jgi:hypothetical protein
MIGCEQSIARTGEETIRVTVLVAATARVKDWKALQQTWRATSESRARRIHAARFRLYRNAHDASQALLVIELPDLEGLGEIGEAVSDAVRALLEGAGDERIWEAIERIG